MRWEERQRVPSDFGNGYVSMGPIKLIFVLSSPHSGSTWVGYVLGSTPKSAFLGEYYRVWDDQLRVPCTLCATRGLDACPVLQGAELVPNTDAFRFAARRTGASVLIDNSKVTSWATKFVNSPELDCRFVHVLKDPRGWISSMRRRHEISINDAIAEWHRQNTSFANFARQAGPKATTVCYDLLALRAKPSWKRLFRFCGLPFEDQALRYWETEHHGFAANGASDALVKTVAGQPPSPVRTGDDAFYAGKSQQQFHDDRWRESLTEQEQEEIQTNPYVRKLLAELGYRLTRTGIWPAGLTGRLGWFSG
jgi:hypothetical protein